MNSLKRVTRKAKTACKQICYALIFNAAGSNKTRRIARNCHIIVLKAGHPVNVYKMCLITESHYLNQQASNEQNNLSMRPLRLPIADQLFAFVKIESLHKFQTLKARLKNTLPHLKLIIRQKLRNSGVSLISDQAVAGVFHGLSHRTIVNDCKNSYSGQLGIENGYSYFDQINNEASDLYQWLTAMHMSPQHHANHESPPGKVGVLISCYNPETHISGFLDNLLSLRNLERLVPIFINAGMSNRCRDVIQTRAKEASFGGFIFIDKPGCGIYEAWNLGVKATDDSIAYLTNFNVDDRRHPYCLEIQAAYLDIFQKAQVSITDYLYFFKACNSIENLYNANKGQRTYIPVTNKRTLLYRNLPHSSPMWRKSLHTPGACGLFDESYKSAGDAEFWYRVSRMHQNPFDIISIPLSLYYQNPEGISTRPNTRGISEHQICSREQYLHIMDAIDYNLSHDFTISHLNNTIHPEYLQIYAAASFLKKT